MEKSPDLADDDDIATFNADDDDHVEAMLSDIQELEDAFALLENETIETNEQQALAAEAQKLTRKVSRFVAAQKKRERW